MNEEQLADLLDEYLAAYLAGEPLAETAPAEIAELLAIAQSLPEVTPIPRPELGADLKESLLGPASNSNNGPTPATGSSPTFSRIFIGLLITVAGLALVASLAIVVTSRSNQLEAPSPTVQPGLTQTAPAPTATDPAGSPSPTASPSQTQTTPAQNPPVIQTPALPPLTTPAITSTVSTTPVASPTLTITPIIDVLPPITVTIEIRIEPPALVPGGSGGDGGSSGGGSNSGGGGNGGGNSGGGGSGGGDSDDDGSDG